MSTYQRRNINYELWSIKQLNIHNLVTKVQHLNKVVFKYIIHNSRLLLRLSKIIWKFQKNLKFKILYLNLDEKMTVNYFDSLECPLCMEVPHVTPAYQYKSQPIVCKKHFYHFGVCNTCRGALGLVKDPIMQSLYHQVCQHIAETIAQSKVQEIENPKLVHGAFPFYAAVSHKCIMVPEFVKRIRGSRQDLAQVSLAFILDKHINGEFKVAYGLWEAHIQRLTEKFKHLLRPYSGNPEVHYNEVMYKTLAGGCGFVRDSRCNNLRCSMLLQEEAFVELIISKGNQIFFLEWQPCYSSFVW